MQRIGLEQDGALPVGILQSLWAVPWGAEDESFNSVKLCVGCVWPQAMFTIPRVHWNVELSSLMQIMFGFFNCLTKQNL